jgi:hypothetical protein
MRFHADLFPLIGYAQEKSLKKLLTMNFFGEVTLARSSQVSSKFGVYKFLVFSEILARSCALVFLEHHQPTQHG